MIAYLLASLGEWRERHLRRTILFSALLITVAGLIGPLSPLLVAVAATLVFVAVAWAEGLNPQREPKPRADPRSFPAGAGEIAAGKALAVLLIWLGLLFVLSPILAASALAWGLPAEAVLACLLCWLSAQLLASAIHFLSKVAFDRTEGIVGFCAYSLLLGWSFFSEEAGIANPFVQVVAALRPGKAAEAGACARDGAAAAIAAAAEIGAAVAIFASAALVLAVKNRGRTR